MGAKRLSFQMGKENIAVPYDNSTARSVEITYVLLRSRFKKKINKIAPTDANRREEVEEEIGSSAT